MNIQWFKNLFNRLFKKEHKSEPKWPKDFQYPIEFAFAWEGVNYYAYTNAMNVPYQRAFVALDYIEEFNMRVTREYLETFTAAIKSEFAQNPINVTEVVRLINNLEERLGWVVAIDTVYKLASVTFFTEEENPMNYDLMYNKKKIDAWKKSDSLGFFLAMPLEQLTIFSKFSTEELQDYLRGQAVKMLMQLEYLRNSLSKQKSESSKKQLLDLEIAELEELIQKI